VISRLGCSVTFMEEAVESPPVRSAAARLTELGYESLWSAEAYGGDCFTPLAWWGAHAADMRLGTAVTQLAARTPAATAMAVMMLDKLSGGRAVLGLGVSGPQVVEGWYGGRFERPLQWTREYVEIVRAIVARSGPVEFQGDFYRLPARRDGGYGKAIRSSLRAPRTSIPIYIGAEGPRNIALAAEIGDGWLPTNFSPAADSYYRQRLAEGFDRRPGGRPAGFEVAATVSVAIADDVESAADRLRPRIAMYIGGMGAKDANFHANAIAQLGFAAACQEIQDRFLARDREGAAAAVPTALIEALTLVGPAEKIAADLALWHKSVVTTLIVRGTLSDCAAVSAALDLSRSSRSEGGLPSGL
jgi:F420-dependent oxidoreductase-like protein